MAILMVASLDSLATTPDNGILLESTRVVYPASAKNGVTFTVTNRTSQVYLLQSRILPWHATPPEAEDRPERASVDTDVTYSQPMDKETGFVILPPLIRFAPDEEMTLRIRLVDSHLPTDRESVFTLAIKAIPNQSALTEGPARLALALQNNLKLFYRPADLPILTAPQRAEKLRFSCAGEGLTVTNPTPYAVTLATLNLGDQAVSLGDGRMIAPFTSAIYPVENCQEKSLRWQIINDEGFYTPEQSQRLERKK